MKVLICSATKIEAFPLKWPLRKAKIPEASINFLSLGIGNLGSTLALTRYIETKGKPDLIINIGIAGYISDEVQKWNVYQIARVVHHQTKKERVLQLHLTDASIGEIISSDTPMLTDEWLSEGGIPTLIDMESWGVCFVAEHYQISKILLKIAYDRVGEETKNFDKDECKKYLQSIDIKNIVHSIQSLIKASK